MLLIPCADSLVAVFQNNDFYLFNYKNTISGAVSEHTITKYNI